MRVRWLHASPPYVGGAELTMGEFKAAAPESVEFVDDKPDVTVVGNFLPRAPVAYKHRVVQYHHDMQHPPIPGAIHVMCSPLQQQKLGLDGPLIPPAVLSGYQPRPNGNRAGDVCIGRMAYGKGLRLLAEWPEPVDVYSSVPFPSEGNARYKGATQDPAETLAHYRRFVFLPTAIEPFGRAVVEAWASGLEPIVNRNVGAAYWLREENQAGLYTAAQDFWDIVLETNVPAQWEEDCVPWRNR